jgi:hypothetical protein
MPGVVVAILVGLGEATEVTIPADPDGRTKGELLDGMGELEAMRGDEAVSVSERKRTAGQCGRRESKGMRE